MSRPRECGFIPKSRVPSFIDSYLYTVYKMNSADTNGLDVTGYICWRFFGNEERDQRKESRMKCAPWGPREEMPRGKRRLPVGVRVPPSAPY